MAYVLKADTKDGTYYYMNIICITEQVENAQHYATEDEAKKDLDHFKNLFHYEDITPTIEEYSE